jgi:hypothetical protein
MDPMTGEIKFKSRHSSTKQGKEAERQILLKPEGTTTHKKFSNFIDLSKTRNSFEYEFMYIWEDFVPDSIFMETFTNGNLFEPFDDDVEILM